MESTPGGWDEGKSKTLTEDGDKNERERDREKRNQNRAFVRKGPVVRYIFPVTESSSVQNIFLKFWRNNDLSFSKYAPTNIIMDRMSNLWCHVCTYICLISIRSYFYQWLRSLQRKHVHISSRPPWLSVVFARVYFENERNVFTKLWDNSILQWYLPSH